MRLTITHSPHKRPSLPVWIQMLAYTSISSSLLAASVECWGTFKMFCFGRSALHERCQRRQQKLDGLKAFSARPSPFYQFSFDSLFSIALAENIWTLQHIVASVITTITAFRLMFYVFCLTGLSFLGPCVDSASCKDKR